jgi:SAM-dependent methyltransferase
VFTWTDDKMRWFCQAARYTGFYENLARIIARYLPAQSTICDSGCGPGFLATALARLVSHVTAIDISQAVLAELAARKPDNVTVICCDAFRHVPAEPYDAAVFCYFGSDRDILAQYRRRLARQFVVIRPETAEHHFAVSRAFGEKDALGSMLKLLDKKGIAYRQEHFSLEFGQPFSSLADAVTFFRYYDQSGDPSVITEQAVRPRLTCTGDQVFPYYLPACKKIGLAAWPG